LKDATTILEFQDIRSDFYTESVYFFNEQNIGRLSFLLRAIASLNPGHGSSSCPMVAQLAMSLESKLMSTSCYA
jgi:hypothetical protein